MYNEMIYRNDELKRDLEQADGKAARGWRFSNVPSRESQLLAKARAIVGRAFIAVGRWLVAERGEWVASGQPGLTSAA